MDSMLLRIFMDQILSQCNFVLWAAREVEDGLKGRNRERVFYAIQNLLNASANISKALWGAGGRRASERQALRDRIGIEDTSPLRQVTMRNNFEHFDERLVDWWKQSPNHLFIDSNIGKTGSLFGTTEPETFRHFDPTNCDVIFWGQSFNLRYLVEEVERILPTVREETAKPLA